MIDEPRRVLILTSDMGFGHRSAALALAAALQETYPCTVDIINPFDHDKIPAFVRETQSDYDKIVRQMPNLYRLGYQVMDAPLSTAIIESAFTVMLYEVMDDLIEHYRPDVIVATRESWLAPLQALFTIRKQQIPVVTVVTDLATVLPSWFNDVSDLCAVPTERVRRLAVESDFPADRIKITGIPVHPRMANESRSKAEIRRSLGWLPNVTTVLAVGSKRVEKLYDTLHILNHAGFPLQLVVVAGGDAQKFVDLMRADWHIPVEIYNFVEDMPTLMQASDFIICKAGGLIVTEALACGLPILITDVIPGQETGNVEYVLDGDAGVYIENPIHALETLCHWLTDDQRELTRVAANARALGRPGAAEEIAAHIWRFAQQGAYDKPQRNTTDFLALVDLLNRFDVSWRRENSKSYVR